MEFALASIKLLFASSELTLACIILLLASMELAFASINLLIASLELGIASLKPTATELGSRSAINNLGLLNKKIHFPI